MQRILSIGLGPLGLRVAQDLCAGVSAKIVAAVDSSPALAGRALAELVPGAPAELRVLPGLVALDPSIGIDCAILTTASDLPSCMASLRGLLERRISVVSSSEELLYPWMRHPGLASELEELCLKRQARVLGTGVNPGYLMDALPAFATSVCRSVERVQVWRIQDASPRRIPFQKKIGAGLDLDAFEARVRDGTLRHVGLGESLHFLAAALDWEIERWEETLEPVIATRAMSCGLGPIRIGDVAGVRQVARAIVQGEERLHFEFHAVIGQENPHDRVRIEGEPVVDLLLQGGVHGDIATSAILVNCVAALLAAPPGLHTMATIPIASCRSSARRA
ncbi:MAG TPA: dihydrodipicolinate reductase [Planctomycetota bacterium]|nr:dihydrodipicolinate reductase [Planctomycetota bacterium]